MKQPDEGNLFTDLMEVGPAPTMARELVVIVITLALLAVVFAIVGPGLLIAVAGVASVLFFGVRFAIGMKHWEKSA